MVRKKEKEDEDRTVRELILGEGFTLRLVTESEEDGFRASLEVEGEEGSPPVSLLQGSGRREGNDWSLTLSLDEKEAWAFIQRLLDRLTPNESDRRPP